MGPPFPISGREFAVIVILEGPDNAGKTHLAQQLVTRIQSIGRSAVTVHHKTPEEGQTNLLETYITALKDAESRLVRSRASTIFDRLALSEVIYGSVMRGGHKLGRDGYTKFLKAADSVNAKTIILTTAWDTVCDLWKERQATEYVQDKGLLYDIWEAYQSRAFNLRAPGTRPIAYDWQKTPFETLCRELGL